MSKLNPKLILFDFDGTVADTGRGIFNCVGYAASAFGWALPDEEALRSFVGPPLHDSFRRVFGVSEEQALSAVEKYRELYSTEGMFQFDVYEGITQVIEAVRSEGIKTAVVGCGIIARKDDIVARENSLYSRLFAFRVR